MFAMATVVKILHIDKIVFNINHFIFFTVLFGTIFVGTLDIVDTRKSRIVFEVFV
jgi:hypothetical protein